MDLNFKTLFNNKTFDEKLIIGLAISLFLPYVITTAYVVFLAIYIIIKKNYKKIFVKTKGSKYLIILAIYMFLTSMFFSNYLGAIASISLVLLFLVFLFYRTVITKELFELLISIMIFMSLFSVVYGVFEQMYYINHLDAIVNFFDISNTPKYRVHAFYANANYYAMMIVFVELFCVHKLISTEKHKVYYNIVAALNLLALFLTGSRFAWLVLILSLIIMFIISKKYIAFIGTLGLSGIMILLISFNIPIIPRLIENGVSLDRRQTIYEAASLMIKDTWLFGQGPLTYRHLYPHYLDEYIRVFGDAHLTSLGISSEHTHSILLEPLVSFGIIGSIIFLIFLYSQYKDIFILHKLKVDRNLTNLIIAITAIVIFSDIIDLSILWIQTGLLFFMIIGSSSIYDNEIKEYENARILKTKLK